MSASEPRTCSFCRASEIIVGIRVGQTAEVGSIGLSYKTGFLVVGREPLAADLCQGCGTVRLYVKERGRKWITQGRYGNRSSHGATDIPVFQ